MSVVEFAKIYSIHFELRFFDSIYKVSPSGIRTHDFVLTVHTLSLSIYFSCNQSYILLFFYIEYCLVAIHHLRKIYIYIYIYICVCVYSNFCNKYDYVY